MYIPATKHLLQFVHYTGRQGCYLHIILATLACNLLLFLAAIPPNILPLWLLFLYILKLFVCQQRKMLTNFFTIIKNKCVCYICSRMGALSFRTRMGTFHFCSRMGALFFSYTHGYVIIADAWLHSLRYNIHTCNTVYFASMYMAIFPAGNANINFPF